MKNFNAVMGLVIILILGFAVGGIVGCTVPVGDDFDRMVEAVGQLPGDVRQAANLETANRRAARWWASKPQDETAIEVHCTFDAAPMTPTYAQQHLDVSLTLTPLDVLKCLNLQPFVTYETCLEQFAREFERMISEENGGEDVTCYPVTVEDYEEADGRDDWTSERVVSREVVIGLLEATAPPKWYLEALVIIAGASGMPGIPRLAPPSLCAQGVDWGCPTHPLFPGRPRPGDGQ